MAKFFKFTIQGDSINPDLIASSLRLPCEIFYKDSIILHKIGKNEYHFLQKTNRVVYSDSVDDSQRIDGFITKKLKNINYCINNILPYIKDAQICIEVVIYHDKKAKISINKTQAKLLSKLNCKLDIIFL